MTDWRDGNVRCLPQVTQLVSGKAGVWTQAVKCQGLCSLSLYSTTLWIREGRFSHARISNGETVVQRAKELVRRTLRTHVRSSDISTVPHFPFRELPIQGLSNNLWGNQCKWRFSTLPNCPWRGIENRLHLGATEYSAACRSQTHYSNFISCTP